MKTSVFTLLLSIFVISILAGISSEELFASADPNVVGLWLFDEGSGSIVRDSSGNGPDGKVVKASWAEGKFIKALEFNREGFVEVPHSAKLALDIFTIEAWVKVELIDDFQGIVSKTNDVGRTFGLFVITKGFGTGIEGGIHAGITPPGGFAAGQYATFGKIQVTDGKWHHVAMTYDGKGFRVYVDGVLDAEVAAPLPIYHSDTPLHFGTDLAKREVPTRHPMKGALDEISIWKVARTVDEIKADMEGLAGVTVVKPSGKLATAWGNLKRER